MTNDFSVESILKMLDEVWGIFSTPILELSGSKISVLSIFFALVLFYLSTILSRYCQKLTERILEKKQIDKGVKGSISKIVGHLAQIAGVLIALDMIGINLNSLVASFIILAKLQPILNIAQNFISGLIILFERPIKKGDLVEVDGVYGRISEIGSRSTTVTTKDDVSIIVPNSKFISEHVVNDSFSGERRRFHVAVGVAYGSDVKKVKQILLDIALDHPKILKTPAPDVFFKDFGNSSLDFDLLIWLEELWESERILSQIRYSINEAFIENSVEIPFPQRDLHIRSGLHPSS